MNQATKSKPAGRVFLKQGDNHPKPALRCVSAWIPEAMDEKLRRVAKRNKRSKSAQLAWALEQSFGRG